MQTGWESCPVLDVAGEGGRQAALHRQDQGSASPSLFPCWIETAQLHSPKPSREKKCLIKELMASLQSFCVRVWFSPAFTQLHSYPSIPLAPVGKKLTPGKSLLGRLRAKKKWEGFCQGKEIQLKILMLGGLGRAAQTLGQ